MSGFLEGGYLFKARPLTIRRVKIMERPKQSVYLEKDFRNILFCRAYDDLGSLGQIAHELGYQGQGRNGTVRRMWQGETPISWLKIERLAKITGISLEEIVNHKVKREQNIPTDNWMQTFREYQSKKQTH